MPSLRRTLTRLALLVGLAGVASPLALADEPQPAASSEAALSAEQVVDAVRETYAEVNTIRADFTQTTRSATMGEQRLKGRMTLQRPNKARWDSTSQPTGSLFVANGEKMWLYSPSDKQVLVYDDLAAAGGGSGLADLLTGLDNLDEHFKVELMDAVGAKDRRVVRVKLTPKAEAQFKEARLVFTRKKYELESVTTVDAFGVETEIALSQVKLNPEIDASEFSFTPPEGVEVIDADGL